MKKFLKRIWTETEGQDLVEYILLLSLIALVSVASMKGFATALTGAFQNAATAVTGAGTAGGGNPGQ
jgi:Flp pilus assembly pilin Flp